MRNFLFQKYQSVHSQLSLILRNRQKVALGLLFLSLPLAVAASQLTQNLQNRAAGLPSTPVTDPFPPKSPITWKTDTVSLNASDFYILTNGQKYTAQGASVALSSDPGSPTYTTLEAIWQENDREMRLFMYFTSDGDTWSATEMRTYNGQEPGDWVYYDGGGIASASGTPFFSQTLDHTSLPTSPTAGTIHFEELRVHAFTNITTPSITPSLAPSATPIPTHTPTVIPTATSTPTPILLPPGTGTGLRGIYYNRKDFTHPKLQRLDPRINFDWGTNSPANSMDNDTFSIRWQGYVQPQSTGVYTFYTLSDEGVRLWINNTEIISNWTPHTAREDKGTIYLVAGQKYPVTLEYFEDTKQAVMRLRWSGPGIVKQTIPKTQLYPQ